MDVKNVLNACAQVGGNTGFGDCVTNIGFIRGIIFVPKDATYTTASVAALKTALEAALLNDLPSQRAYPVSGFVTPTDNSEDVTLQTFADGSKAVVRDAVYDWTFEFVDGAFCLTYALRKANGMNRHFLIYDDSAKLIGTDAGNGLMKGIEPVLAWTNPWKLNTGAAVTVYSTRVSFYANQVNESIAFVDFSNDGGLAYLKGLMGLQNINLYQAVARSTNVLKVGGTTACGSVNIHDLYASELAVGGAWKARNKATKSVIAITSVADDATDNAWTITLNASDPNYTSTAGGVEVSLVGPTELDALDVSGYESNWLAQ